MDRNSRYILLWLACMAAQIFFFDHLLLSVWLNPLVYVAFILLLPLETPPAAVLGYGLLTGLAADLLTGAGGLNTLATLPAAYLRRPLIEWLDGRDGQHDNGVPSRYRLGNVFYFSYVATLVVLHHTIFFAFESLSWVQLPYTLLRIVSSAAVTIAFTTAVNRIILPETPSSL